MHRTNISDLTYKDLKILMALNRQFSNFNTYLQCDVGTYVLHCPHLHTIRAAVMSPFAPLRVLHAK